MASATTCDDCGNPCTGQVRVTVTYVGECGVKDCATGTEILKDSCDGCKAQLAAVASSEAVNKLTTDIPALRVAP